MSRPRQSSNAESGTAFKRVIPDSYPDDYRTRGRDQDRDVRPGSSFYRRDFVTSQERNRAFHYHGPNRNNSLSGNAELDQERPRLPSRKSIPDHRLVTDPSQSPDSRRNSGQSSPKVHSGSRSISPRSDLPRSGVATPTATTAPSALPAKLLNVDGVGEEPAGGSKADVPNTMVIKDPRLRRTSTKMKQIPEAVDAALAVSSPGPLTPPVNRAGLINESTSNLSVPPTFFPSNPDTQFAGSGDGMKSASALPDPVARKPSTETTDVAMTDVNQPSSIVASEAQDPLPAIQSRPSISTSSELMESFMKLMMDFVDQVSTTSILKYKKDIAKQKSARCKYNDRRNRENFKDYPVTIEQGTQARQLAEQELASVDQKLKDHVKVQNELARTMAGAFVSQIELREGAQTIHSEKARVLQEKLDQVEELSTNLTSTLAEAKQTSLNAAKSIKEAHELVERAMSTCEEAQQAAQKSFTQVHDVTVRVNELSVKVSAVQMDGQQAVRNISSMGRTMSEDHAQTAKVTNVVQHLEDDVNSLRKRMAETGDDLRSLRKRTTETEDDVKRLWDNRAASATLERLRKEVSGDVAQLKNTQKDMFSQVRALDASLKECRQSYDTLAPKVEAHSKTIGDINVLPEASEGNNRKRLYGIEIPKSPSLQDGRSVTPAKGLQSDIDDLRRSFQDLSTKFGSLASQSDLLALRDAITRLQTAMEKLDTEKLSKELEARHKAAEADREDLRDLTKEVDALHSGQDQIRETVMEHNERIANRVEKAEKDVHEISEELKTNVEKAKEEAEAFAKQINSMSKKVDATMTATTAPSRPTPPSAPPTPQMHPSTHLPRRGSSPVVDGGVVTGKLNEVAQELRHLKGYLNNQFSISPNLPATFNSLNQAILNLQSRYNNLTAEPVVRAMVQQMQVMYPYASTAQNDIRDLRATVSELEKLLPRVDSLSSHLDLHSKDIAKLDEKAADHDKERASSDNKQERLVAHVKEERDNLKQHVQDQYEKLKQHVDEQYEKMDRHIAATQDESVSSMAQVAAQVRELARVAEAWNTTKRAESLSELGDQDVPSTPAMEFSVTRPPVSRWSPSHHRPSHQTRASSPGESDHEALLKKYEASTRARRVEANSGISDTDDSDAPLGATRRKSSKSVPASPNVGVPGTSGKRKRGHHPSSSHDERQSLWEVPSSPSKRKVARRS